jgi:GR25 family glycosyltransferase involved in LPS biosynthesis
MNNNKINLCTHVLNKYFDNIYILYISDFELTRIKHKLSQFKIPLSVEYFKGVNGKETLSKTFKEYYDINSAKKTSNYITKIGAFGHLHSTINIINDAIKKNYNKILLLEPDIYFSATFDDDVEQYLSMDYKLLYLGASQHKWDFYNGNDKLLSESKLYYANVTYGTFAIGIDCSIFNEYLENLRRLESPSDVCLVPIQEKYKTGCIVTFPNLISCDITKSTTAPRKKLQFDLISKFRWNSNYIINDKLTYRVLPDVIYKVIIEINHFEKNRQLLFKISDDFSDITPTIIIPNKYILEKKNKIFDGNINTIIDTYVIFIYTSSSNIYINTENIYIDDVILIERFKNVKKNVVNIENHFKQEIMMYLNSEDKLLASYYEKLLYDIHH